MRWIPAVATVVFLGFGCSAPAETIPVPISVPAPAAVPDWLASVRADMAALKADTANLGTCHDRTHELGRHAYETFGLGALDASDEWCNAGYVHGVIEAALSASTDPEADIAALCAGRDPKTFAGWQCWHGVGHGLMDYALNDLPTALAACRALPVGGAECANGAFMENFVAGGETHATSWRRDDDSFYPCDSITSDALREKESCHLYAPVWYLERHGHDYTAAFEWCLGAEEYVGSCVRGVGSQAMKDKITDPESVVAVCVDVATEWRADCIAGMAGIVAFHNASIAPAEAWCERRDAADRTACDTAIASLRPMFDK